MNVEKKWPFYPDCLTDIIPAEVLKILFSGVSDKGKLPITLYEFCEGVHIGNRTFSSSPVTARHSSDCRSVYKSISCISNSPIKKKLKNVGRIIDKTSKEPTENFELVHCPTDSLDVYLATMGGKVLAVCPIKKYYSSEDAFSSKDCLNKLHKEREEILSELVQNSTRPIEILAENTLTKLSSDFLGSFKKICQVVEEYYRRSKIEAEWNFREKIDFALSNVIPQDDSGIDEPINKIVNDVRDFVNVAYIAIFISQHPQETVLPLVSFAGLTDPKVHFSWEKATLSSEPSVDLFTRAKAALLEAGIRGQSTKSLTSVSCAVSFNYSDGHRGIILLGPFSNGIDIEREEYFLKSISQTLMTRIKDLLIQNSLRKSVEKNRLITSLTAHAIRSRLNGLMGETYVMEHMLKGKRGKDFVVEDGGRMSLAIERISHEVEELAMRAKFMMKLPYSMIVDLDKSEIEQQEYSLAVLVANCATRFVALAKQCNKIIDVDDSVDYLPSAQIEPFLIDQALANLIDNAIKYSQEEKAIVIYGDQQNYEIANIRVKNYGWGIPEQDIPKIFQTGYRSTVARKHKDVLGTGLGLYQTKAFIELNNGRISVQSTPAYRGADIKNYITIFTITLPLQKARHV